MTRVHPFDYAFGTVAGEWFPAIRTATQGPVDRAAFLRLPAVQELLGGRAGGAGEEHEELLTLLYVAFRFWADGRRTGAVGRPALERAIDADVLAPAPLPAAACYLQLPERWIWSQVSADAPHEPLDGLFLAPEPGPAVLVTGVLGLRAERGGFGQVSTWATVPDYDDAGRGAPPPRLAPAMDGGARAGFRSVRSNADLLVLAGAALGLASLAPVERGK